MSRKILTFSLLLLVQLFIMTAQPSAQTIRIQALHSRLSDVLLEFEKQSGIAIVFANSLIDSVTVSCDIEAAAVYALSAILLQTPFDFLQNRPGQWVIVPRARTRHLPGEISGRIIDGEEKPLPGANVHLKGTGHGTTTDSKGHFSLADVAAGQYDLSIDRIGYEPRSTRMVLRGNEKRFLRFQMVPRPRKMPAVVIEENPQAVQIARLSMAEQQFNNEQLNMPPLRGHGEILEIMHQQPGVSRRRNEDLIPHLEGGAAYETVIELDGIPIIFPTFSHNRRSFFSTSQITSLTIHRAGYGLARGDALSGIVAMRTQAIRDIPHRIRASVTPSEFDVQTTINRDRWGWTLSWRAADLRDGRPGRLSASDLFSKMSLRLSESERLSFLLLRGTGSLIQSNSAESSNTDTYNFGIVYEAGRDSLHQGSVTFYQTSLEGRALERGLKFQQKRSIGGEAHLIYGLHLLNARVQTQVTYDSLAGFKDLRVFEDEVWSSEPSIHLKTSLASPYLGAGMQRQRYSWQLGLRMPMELEHGLVRVEPRFRFSVFPVKRVSVYGALGRYHQFTSRGYLSEAKSGDTEGLGEYFVKTSSRPSSAMHGRLGLAGPAFQAWRFSFSTFQKDYDFTDRFYLSRISNKTWFLPLRGGVVRGAEFWLGKSYGRSQGWVSYSISTTRYKSEGGLQFKPYFHHDDILQIVYKQSLSGPWQLHGHYAQYSGYPLRGWNAATVKLDPDINAEDFHRLYFTDSQTTGSLKQLTLGLKWFWGDMVKNQSVDVVARFNQEILNDTPQTTSELWFMLHWAY